MTSAAQFPISAFSDVEACHTELLRQRIAFEEELRAQRSYYDTKLKEVNEQLGFREVDCRNLQTVVTILGRKLDALASVVEGLVLEKHQSKGRYPPNRAPSASASFSTVFSPYEATPEYNHGMHAASAGRPRSGSVGSTASNSTMGARGVAGVEKYSAFGRTNSSAFTPRGGAGASTASTFPEEKVRPPSPSRRPRRAEEIVTTTLNTTVETSRTTSVINTSEHVKGLPSDDSRAVVGAGAVVVPQHSYIVVGQRKSETEDVVAQFSNTEEPALDKGNVPSNQRELRTVVAVPSAASRAAVATARPSLNGTASTSRTANTKNEMFLPSGPSASSRSLALTSADTSVAAATPTSIRRLPSPRSLAFTSAYRPADALSGGNSAAVGLRGPTPTRVARVTPERLRDGR